MLKKPHRLKGTARFQEIKRKGQSTVHPLLVLTVMSNGLLLNRFGFTAGRRIGGAVKRNRARRLMSEAIRLRFQTIKPGYDLVLTARQPIQDATFAEVDRAIEKVLQRAGLLQSGGSMTTPASDVTGDNAQTVHESSSSIPDQTV